MNARLYRRKRSASGGFTLVELVVAIAVLAILAGAAVPVVRAAIKRQKERELRHALWQIRDAIDWYKDVCEAGAFESEMGADCYPKSLDMLMKVQLVNGKRVRFLRHIPVDPMTGTTEWGLRAEQDDPDSNSWGGQDVFDVHTKSEGTALDGSKYAEW